MNNENIRSKKYEVRSTEGPDLPLTPYSVPRTPSSAAPYSSLRTPPASPIRSFKDLRAWQEGHALVLAVYRLTRKYPKDELFALVSQMRRAAVSITSNIAEGFGRASMKEKVQFYSIAQGSVTELQNQLLVSKDVSYISATEFYDIEAQAECVHKILTGLLKSSRARITV